VGLAIMSIYFLAPANEKSAPLSEMAKGLLYAFPDVNFKNIFSQPYPKYL